MILREVLLEAQQTKPSHVSMADGHCGLGLACAMAWTRMKHKGERERVKDDMLVYSRHRIATWFVTLASYKAHWPLRTALFPRIVYSGDQVHVLRQ